LAVVSATAINLARVAASTRFTAILSTIKLGSLLVLAIAGLMAAFGLWPWAASAASGQTPAAPAASALGVKSWFLGLVGVLWCYEGFLEIVVVAGEVRQPARTLVRALVLSVVLIALVYGGYTLALYLDLGLVGIASSATVAADLARLLFGESASWIMNTVVLMATFSAAQALLFSGPRLLVGLADGGVISPMVARLSPKRGVPALAVVGCGSVALIYALVGEFEELVKYFAFATGIFSSLILLGGMWLRMRGRVPKEARRIPLWPLPSILAVVAALGGSFWVLRDQPRSSLIGLALMLCSLPLWRFFGNPSRSSEG
jgi:amino acid transporter